MTAINYPVIVFSDRTIRVRKNEESLTTTTKAGLKNGMFDNILIVGIDGLALRIKTAKKSHGVGFLWGYNIFFNQRIKVELECDNSSFSMSIDDVKREVLKNFKKWHGWKSRGDFEELVRKVKSAYSISEIINLIGD